MPTTVSVAAATRQSFGVMFNHSSKDAGIVRDLLGGSLRLAPHPEWQLPEVIDWRADPFESRNWRAQLHMLRWLDPLRRRAEKGDTSAGEAWLRYAQDWVEKNRPGTRAAPEAWLNMVDGIRALELCLAVPFVSRFHPKALDWLSDSIRTHADWMIDERHLGHSNHALHQHQALFVCGAVLEDPGLQSLAERRLAELFEASYDEQGINNEGAIMYHLANYNWWSMARRRLIAEDRPVPDRMKVLDEVPIELAHATKPGGKFVSIGDTDGGDASRVDHPAARWVSTMGADGEPPEDLIRIYDAGYVFARSGWGDQERAFADETFWSASFGSSRRVHGHVDGGSLTFSSMGHEWVTDPGKYQYGTSAMRDYCLDRASHSLVSIEDRPYSASSSVECIRQKIDGTSYDLTFKDEGFEDVTLTRRVVYSVSGEYLVIVDHVDADTEVTGVQNWQCGASTAVHQVSRGFELTGPENRKACVLYTGTRPQMSMAIGQEDPIAGWVATGWKTREAAPSLRFSKTGRRFRFVTVVAAGFRETTPTMETLKSAVPGQLRLRVDTGRVAEQIVIGPGTVQILGPNEEMGAVVHRSTRTGAPVLNPLSRKTRQRIFTETRTARDAARGEGSAGSRRAAADRLRAVLASYDVRDGLDLGLQAAISDLTGVSHAGLPRKEIRRDRPGLINWDNNPAFRSTQARVPMVSLHGTDENPPPLTTDTLVTYALGSLVLPSLVLPGHGDTMTVMLHTAVDRARVSLPLFQRVRYQRELAAGPIVAFGDPTLDLSRELRLGWYLGNEEVDLPRAMSAVLQRLARQLGTSKFVIQGGSGGGFAALQVGAHIPGAHVMAANPQTDLRKYNVRAYRAAMIAAFGIKDASRSPQLLSRVDAARRIIELNSEMSISMVMNTGDLYHQRNHAAPFKEALKDSQGVNLMDVNVDLGPGHKGLNNAQYGEIMNSIYSRIGSES
ncbi:heparinase II/III domain-containing protein [Brachybacterium tyrofermentans]|uniref:heparinase II/III domain-containing protein n=1 Tax=Brachybacterium tyrofermentans TaxID=47848 RepID=UPI003FCF794F